MTGPLRELKVEVTYSCPLSCIHCSSDASPDSSDEMVPSECLRLVREAADMGLEELALSGGEPLLWTGFNEVVEYAAQRDIKVTAYTSGNVNNVTHRFEVAHQLGLGRVVVSIFGGSETAHELVTRKQGSFTRTLDAASTCIALGLRTELHFVALGRNYRELPAIAALASQLGISTISVLRFVPQGRGVLLRSDVLDRRQNQEMRRTISRLREEGYSLRTGSPMNVFWLNAAPRCFSGVDRLVVSADMQLYPCDAFKQLSARAVVGTDDFSDLRRYSLADCWKQSPYLVEVRRSIAAERSEPCSSCGSYELCGSGCLAQKVLADGQLHTGPDPACLLKGA